LLHNKKSCASLLAFLTLLLTLSGCAPSLFQKASAQAVGRSEQAITSPHQPYRVTQVCLDGPPFFKADLFHQAATQIADKVDALVAPNQDGLLVYVSLIEHDSLQTSVMTIKVPALPADPAQPQLKPMPNSSSYNSPYDLAQAVEVVKKSNTDSLQTWQAVLKSNHAFLKSARAQVRVLTDKLRGLTAPYDVTGADVFGCLDLASQHFQHVQAQKSLVIASPMINNTTRQKATIDLSGVSVNVIYRNCVIASACASNDNFWRGVLLSSHARSVNFYDPAQSQASLPAF